MDEEERFVASAPSPDEFSSQERERRMDSWSTARATSNEWPEPSSASLLTDDDEVVTYNAESHCNSSWPLFESIRQADKLCDVTLIAGDTHLSVHRIVLAATVPYFHNMFLSEMSEAHAHDIHMHDMDGATLEQLVSFAYTGSLRITVTNVQALLVGANFLQLQSIVDACSRYLQTRLQGCNVLAVRHFANALNVQCLMRAADMFIQKHFVAVSKTADFLQLEANTLMELLSRDELHVSNEEQVFDAAVRWISADVQGRRAQMAQVLACVRLPLLKPAYLADHVNGNELIRSCLRCRDLLDEAKDYHLLPERRPLFTAFKTTVRCCTHIPGIIYAVGGLTNAGDSLSTVEMYDPGVATWTSIQPMTTLRSRVGVAVMNSLLYAIGGFNGHERLKTVEVFDPETRIWKEVTPLNNKRSALGAAVLGDRLYVCGGYDGITSLATVECYDSLANKWTLLAAMSKQRSAAGIAVLKDNIYVMGGHDGTSIFNSVECFNVSTSKWTAVKPMMNRRCRLGACALNGKLYVCGGYDGNNFLRTAEVYDPETEQWTVLCDMNVKRSRVSLVANCGRLFAIGGYDGISNLSSMEMYSIDDNSWSFGASMMAHEGGVGIGVVPLLPAIDIP